MSEKIRSHSFWFIDFLKGGKVKSHYNDIKFILENFNTDKSIKQRNYHLSSLMDHAIKTVPFYKDYKGYNSIYDFPIVDKMLLRESVNDFISNKFKDKSSYEVSTSGSTGTPFVVFQDKNKKNRNTADTLFFGEKAGYKIGHKLFYIRAWSKVISKSRLTTLLQNIRMINVKNLNYESISGIIKEIEKGSSNNAFIGYPSAFKEICKFLDAIEAKPIKAKISSMIANAEPLGDPIKNSIKKYFDFNILSRYSNMENGILSQQITNGGSFFHINWASYYIEVLDLKEDKPADYGNLGRVVVTDLFNYNMPLIRYDTGDLAVMDISNTFNNAPAFTKVEGRKMDTIYSTDGRVMTTVVYELEYFPEIKQFQLIQKDKKIYLVKINIDGHFKQEQKMTTLLKSFLGEDAIIKVEYVDEIPELSSGKRKLTINTMIY
ncbi:phenylacetate--CoA ligase family protein [Jejuia pallidilutea]|uniref:CoF synthetase n=1 Tax=Jejuia pallidilutea TaxID=504487 RepID=UPI00147357C5|nr:CoF synthetase [Jejuia pallidilutea]